MTSTKSTSQPSSSSTPDLQQSQEEDELEREDSLEMRSPVEDEDESQDGKQGMKDNKREETSTEILEKKQDDHLTGSTDSLNFDLKTGNTSKTKQRQSSRLTVQRSLSGQSKRNGHTRHSWKQNRVNQVDPEETMKREKQEEDDDDDDWSRSFESSSHLEQEEDHDFRSLKKSKERKSNDMRAPLLWNNKKNVDNSKQDKWKKFPSQNKARKLQHKKQEEDFEDDTSLQEDLKTPFAASLSSSAESSWTSRMSSFSFILIFLALLSP